MSLAKQARAIERDIFGGLIGALVGLVICRLTVLVTDINLYVLFVIITIVFVAGLFALLAKL